MLRAHSCLWTLPFSSTTVNWTMFLCNECHRCPEVEEGSLLPKCSSLFPDASSLLVPFLHTFLCFLFPWLPLLSLSMAFHQDSRVRFAWPWSCGTGELQIEGACNLLGGWSRSLSLSCREGQCPGDPHSSWRLVSLTWECLCWYLRAKRKQLCRIQIFWRVKGHLFVSKWWYFVCISEYEI